MPIAPPVERLHAIKGILVIFLFGVRTLDYCSEPIQCALCEYKDDYSNLHLNYNTSQIN